MKILIIIILVGLLVYLLLRRFMLAGTTSTSIVSSSQRRHFTLVESSPQLIKRATKSTLRTVGIGFFLFLVILVLGIKIKVLWIILPLALYLIGQVFVYTNQLKYTLDQRLYFHQETYEVLVSYVKGNPCSFNLMRDVSQVTEVRSVQKNGPMMFGYYRLQLKQGVVIIPYLVEQHQHPANKLFFSYLNEHFKIEVEHKLFPIA